MNNNPAPSDADKERYYEIAKWAAERGLALTMHWGPNDGRSYCSTIFERVNREVPIAGLRWSIAHLNDASEKSPRADGRARRRLDRAGRDVLRRRRARARAGAGRRASGFRRSMTGKRLGVAIGAGTDAHRVASYNPFTSLQWFARRQDRRRRRDSRAGGDAEPRGRAALLHARQRVVLARRGQARLARGRQARRPRRAVGGLPHVPADEIGRIESRAHDARRQGGLRRRAFRRRQVARQSAGAVSELERDSCGAASDGARGSVDSASDVEPGSFGCCQPCSKCVSQFSAHGRPEVVDEARRRTG